MTNSAQSAESHREPQSAQGLPPYPTHPGFPQTQQTGGVVYTTRKNINMSTVTVNSHGQQDRIVKALLDRIDTLTVQKRALLKDASGGPVQVVFFDCDDCLYQNNWKTADSITKSISDYSEANLTLPEGVDVYQLYKKHGTSAKGLLVEGHMTDAAVKDFIYNCHAIVDVSDIAPDPAMSQVVAGVTKRRWVFTAAPIEHCERCLSAVGISTDLFRGIIDCQ